MHEIIYFKVKNNRTNRTTKLACKVVFVDTAFKPVTFIADNSKLKVVVGKSSTIFGQKLAINGELTLKIRIHEALTRETILKKLKKEFGNNFTITTYYSQSSITPKKVVSKKNIDEKFSKKRRKNQRLKKQNQMKDLAISTGYLKKKMECFQ